MRWLAQLREWVDGETPELPVVERPRDLFPPAHRTSQEFLIFLARKIDQVLQQEIFVTPKGTTFAPCAFQVLLSPHDHRAWQEEQKHVGLLCWLQEVFAERLAEIVPDSKRSVRFSIQFGLDEHLREGQVQVLPLWQKADDVTPPVTPSAHPPLRTGPIAPTPALEQETVYVYRLPERRV